MPEEEDRLETQTVLDNIKFKAITESDEEE
jgi:hypothetical protein